MKKLHIMLLLSVSYMLFLNFRADTNYKQRKLGQTETTHVLFNVGYLFKLKYLYSENSANSKNFTHI
jgi:hypothetical protein